MKRSKIYCAGDMLENTKKIVPRSLTSLKGQTSIVKIELNSKPLKEESLYSKRSAKSSLSAVDICNSALYTGGEKPQDHDILWNANVSFEDTKIVHKTPITDNKRQYSRMLSVVKLPSENMKLGGSSNCQNNSVKGSASSLSLDNSPEADYTTPKLSTGRARFMSERTSDTALLRPDGQIKFDQTEKYSAYNLGKTHYEDSSKPKNFIFPTPKRKYSNRSYGQPHVRLGGNSNCQNNSMKRSASFLSLDSSPEADYATPKQAERARFMSERTSDTALLRPDRQTKFGQMEKHFAYKLGKTHREDSFKQKSFLFSTPKREYPNKSYEQPHRSHSFGKSAADQTPFSPAESLSQGRIKRMRTSILPSYVSHAELMMLNPGIGIIDTHCHLDFLFTRANFNESYADYRIAHNSSYPVCYEGCIAVFCEPQNFSMKPEWDCILQEKGVWAAFGCHPHMAKYYDEHAERALKIALKDPKVIALGEIGLDYSSRNSCQKSLQHNVFRRQILIALENELPLVIHCREAHDDCMEIMQELVPRDYYIHLHCFTDKWTRAKEWLDAFPNLFIGITNLVTFPSAEDVHETAMKIPLERLLLETDSPYFVPRNLPQQMRWSHPGLVIHAAAQIASLKKTVTINELLRFVRKNTKKMYGI